MQGCVRDLPAGAGGFFYTNSITWTDTTQSAMLSATTFLGPPRHVGKHD